MSYKAGSGGYQFICKTRNEKPILKNEVKQKLKMEILDICKKYQLKDITLEIFPYLFVLIFSNLYKLSQKDFADELLIRTENLLKNEFSYKKVWIDDYLFRTVGNVSEKSKKSMIKHIKDLINESD